jgi:IclR family transcriptional regulator, KDG regulon repressor
LSGKYQAPTVKKAFEILRLISQSTPEISLSDLSKRLEISKSTVHGITAALEELGAVIRNRSNKRYSLGPTLFELGRSAYSRIDLKAVARPVMEALMDKTEETVFLGVLNGDHVTIVESVESRRDMKITSPVGTTLPLLAGAVGKVFLANMEETRAVEIVRRKGIPGYTERTITDPENYLQILRSVRRLGYATDDEEYIPGVRAVAAPIAAEAYLPAAVWVVGFKPINGGAPMGHLVEETKKASERISHRIAGYGDPESEAGSGF